jgi:hypothetical protein
MQGPRCNSEKDVEAAVLRVITVDERGTVL